MAGGIFFNYRREDSASATLLLFTNLKPEFGLEKLFIDVDHISAGADFVQVLDAQVSQCDVMLSIIGPNWLSVIDNDTGLRRLDNPDDFVRIEIEAALERDILIIPVLVDNAEFPKVSDLPASLQSLTRRNFIRLTHERYAGDCQALIKDLKVALEQAEEMRRKQEQLRLAEEQQAKTAQDEERKRQEDQARQSAHAGLSSEEIRMAEELANWKFVDSSPTEALLRDHLIRFPNGTTKMMARTTLDRVVWQRVSENPELEPLKGYLSEFPKGEKVVEARTILKTVTAREDALREQHQRLARQEAAQKEREVKEAAEVERIRREEEAEWHELMSLGFVRVAAIDDLKEFIKKWPKGTYVKEAKQQLREVKREYRELTGAWYSNFFYAIPPFVGAFVLTAILASVAVAIAEACDFRIPDILINDERYFYCSALFVGLLIGLVLFLWTELSWKRVLFGAVLSALGWFGIGYGYYYIFSEILGWTYVELDSYQYLASFTVTFGILFGPLVVNSQVRQINLKQGCVFFLCLILGGLCHLFVWQILVLGIDSIFGDAVGATLTPYLTNYFSLTIILFAPLMACVALLCTPREAYSSDDWDGAEAYSSAGLGYERYTDEGPLRNFFVRNPAWLIVFIISGLLGGIFFSLTNPKNPNALSQIVFLVLPSLLVGMILLLWTNLRIKNVIIGAVLSIVGYLVAICVIFLIGETFKPERSLMFFFFIGVLFALGYLVGPLAVIKEARALNARQITWGMICLLVGGFCFLVVFSFFVPSWEPSILMKFALGGLLYAPLLTCLTLFSTPGISRNFRFSQHDY